MLATHTPQPRTSELIIALSHAEPAVCTHKRLDATPWLLPPSPASAPVRLSVFSFSLAPDDPDDPLDPGGQGHDLYLAAHGAALQIMTAAQATSDAAPATPAAEVVAARPATVECAGAGAGPVLSSSAWVYGSGSWDAGGKATAGPVGTDAPGALGTTPAAAAAGTGPGSAPQDDGPACTPSAGTETPAAARAVAPSWPPVLRSLRSLTVASPVAYPGPLCYLLGGLPGPSMAVLRLSCYASPEAMIDPLGQRLCPMLVRVCGCRTVGCTGWGGGRLSAHNPLFAASLTAIGVCV